MRQYYVASYYFIIIDDSFSLGDNHFALPFIIFDQCFGIAAAAYFNVYRARPAAW